jgi:siroheme synthase-like protein
MSYPVLLLLEGRRVVVVGGGPVASRKAADLAAVGAEVAVISPALTPALQILADEGTIRWYAESFSPARLHELKPLLVFAATDSPSINSQVVSQAHELGALVGAVDDAPGSDLTSMAALHRGRVTLAVATDGASPALAAYLRDQLETVVGEEYAILANWLAELRPDVRKQLPSAGSRRALWQALIGSSILEYLRNGDESAARREISRLLFEAGIVEPVR